MRRIAPTGLLAAFVVAMLFTYGVFFSGHPVSGDNIVQFYQTTQILDRSRLTFRAGEISDILRRHGWELNTRFSLNRDGMTYSQVHGIGQPLMALPLFAAMRTARRALNLPRPADMTLWALNWPIFAAACAVLVLAMCRLVLMDRPHVRLFLTCLLAGGIAIASLNTYYFGSPIATAYHELQGVMDFDGRWLDGFSGTFLSPLKSPLYFFPLSVLFPVALAVVAWRRHRSAMFVVLFMLPQIYFMPKYSMWDGGPDLFARFWLRALPPVFLTLALAARQVSSVPVWRRASFAVALVLSLMGASAQIKTAMTDERAVYARAASTFAQRPDAQGDALGYQDTPADLLIGRTIVARTQRAEIGTPRQFLFFREWPRPSSRLWAAVLGLLASAVSLYAFCVFHERTAAG